MRVNSLTAKLFWAAVIGFELWLLLNDINVLSRPAYVDDSAPNGEPVALLARRQNTVQLQNGGDLVWTETREGEKLYDGQSLLTLGKSEAGIRFDDSSEIIVAENSLIQIQRPPSGADGAPLKLALLRGSIRKTTGRETTPRIEIAIGKQIAVIEGAGEFVARAPVSSTELPTIEATSGNVNVRSLGGGDSIELSPGKRIEITESAWRETSVAPSETPALAEVPPVALEEAPAPSPSVGVIESAPETVATPATAPAPTAPAAKKAAKRLPPPQLMNPPKIRKKPKATPSPPGAGAWLRKTFWIADAHAADPADPYADETWEIELTWKPVSNAKAYVIQIAKDRSFTNLVQVDRTETPTYFWNYRFGMENSKGRVFYRVATENADGRPGKFSPADIIVLPKREVLIAQKKAEETPATPPPTAVKPTPTKPAPSRPAPYAWNRTALALGPQMRSFTQSSGLRQLEEVKSGALFLQEALVFRFEALREKNLRELALSFDPARFEASGARHPNQTEEKTFALKLTGTSWNEERYRRRAWSFGYGILLDRAYRFEKKSLTSVEAAPAYAAGGVAGFRKRVASEGAFTPEELRLQLELPMTGFLMDAQYGARAELNVDWNLNRAGSFGLTLRSEAGYLKYETPSETSVTELGASLLFRYRHLAVKGVR